ncbi:nucleotidyltransferase [Mycoplasmopsis meleagridis]|uniref:nucleotidyltransferase n=1 Tax=Mycoplasmopsis meleagridis TaxID=29561 RepID=UPI00073D5A6C|nr:nucleotidyltransferase [Mycoplasmopsis meleagridis]KUH47338.1 hypothetical protein ASB56_01865 [Mycoplasmopsis meleagridis]
MVGIIVEYNPFHNGHIRQLEFVKKQFPQEKIIIVMSDKFSQRGECILVSFRKRKKIAKKYGVSKVIKMPFYESSQAAHIFAKNAINRLYKAKITKLIFGSESNNPTQMINLAKILKKGEQTFNSLIKKYIKNDKLAYPKAYSLALSELTNKNYDKPNDILGFEYVKYIVNNNLNIEIYTIERNIDFNANMPINKYASGTYLRELIKQNKNISLYSPLKIKYKNQEEKLFKKFKKNMLKYKLEKIREIPLISEGIENLLLKNINCDNYQTFIEKCTSKRYTASRIKRIMVWVANKGFKYKNK